MFWLCTKCREELEDTVITIEIKEDGELVAQAKFDAANSKMRMSQWREPTKKLDTDYELSAEEHLFSMMCHLISYLFAIEDRD